MMKKERIDQPPAVIFIPGVYQAWEEPLVDGLGRRLKIALERNSPASLRYEATPTMKELPESCDSVRMVRISQGQEVVADLYSLDLSSLMIKTQQKTSSAKRVWLLAYYLVTFAPKTIYSFILGLPLVNRLYSRFIELPLINRLSWWHKSTITLADRFQFFIAGCAYIVLLISFFGAIAIMIAGLASLATFDYEWLNNALGIALPLAAAILAVVAMMPKRIRLLIEANTDFILGLLQYLSVGNDRKRAVGKLASFIEYLVDKCQYDRVHIISVSMGAVISIDSLYPIDRCIDRFEQVDTLVTISVPVDVIQHYYSDYFSNRCCLPDTPNYWVNIFMPEDLLASNFILNDNWREKPDEPKPKKQSIKSEKQKQEESAQKSTSIEQPTDSEQRKQKKSVIDWSGIMANGIPHHPDKNIRYQMTSSSRKMDKVFAAVPAHLSYWDREQEDSVSVFDIIAQELFPEHD